MSYIMCKCSCVVCEVAELAVAIVKLQYMRRPNGDWHAIGTLGGIAIVGYEHEKMDVVQLTWDEVRLVLSSVDA